MCDVYLGLFRYCPFMRVELTCVVAPCSGVLLLGSPVESSDGLLCLAGRVCRWFPVDLLSLWPCIRLCCTYCRQCGVIGMRSSFLQGVLAAVCVAVWSYLVSRSVSVGGQPSTNTPGRICPLKRPHPLPLSLLATVYV